MLHLMADQDCIKGSCQYMCPLQEIKFREKHGLLHILEIKQGTEANPKADLEKTIKQFSRSAAGKAEASPADLRTSETLLKTMEYLIDDIVPSDKLPWVDLYGFVNDRIQAVRQDITIQVIEDENSVKIYEKCVRFYIISSYHLCEEPQAKFDQFLNKQQLCICLEKLINLYQKFKSKVMNEFISIHFSLNVDNCEKIYRYETLFKSFFLNDLVKLTLETCLAWIDSNFIKFFLCVKKLPLTLQIAFFHQFGFIRKKALRTLSIAFSSNICRLPVEVLSQWISLTTAETMLLCEKFQINIKGNHICFHKRDFIENEVPHLKKESIIENNLKKTNFSSLINGTPNHCISPKTQL